MAENPNHYKPQDGETYMNDKQLLHFSTRLKNWKKDLLTESQETLAGLQQDETNAADPADRASIETDSSLELRTRDRYRKLIAKIDKALLRIKKNKYGYCENTGDEIGVLRLNARPIATLTIEEQEEHEAYEDSHIDRKPHNIAE